MKKLLTGIIISFLLIVTAGYFYSKSLLNEEISQEEPIMLRIPEGTSLDRAVRLLNEKGVLKPNWFFEYYVRFYAKFTGKYLYAGYFKFPEKLTNYELIEKLFSNEMLFTIRITFPEGYSYRKYAEIAENNSEANKFEFIKLAESEEYLKSKGISFDDAEGYLLPDTYEFYPDASAEDIINRLIDEQNKLWNSGYDKRSIEINYTRHKVLTLASIIEAEATAESEMKRISGVYHNRLKRGWLLQADPTVQFAVGHKERLLYSDLEVNSPYNTYVNAGLPPGPINCPGKAAIEAALYPEKHDYMYFVAIGDGSGLHNFAKTHSEHLRYVGDYRRNLRNYSN